MIQDTQVGQTEGLLPLAFYGDLTFEKNVAMVRNLHKSGFLPPAIKTSEAALFIIQYGANLGLPPIQSLSNIYLISDNGASKIFVGIHAVEAQIAKAGGRWRVEKLTDDGCTIVGIRDGWDEHVSEFTKKDALTAGLTTKKSYQNYPKDIMYANAFRRMARRLFADVLMGVSILDEREVSDFDQGFKPSTMSDVITVDLEHPIPTPTGTPVPFRADDPTHRKLLVDARNAMANTKERQQEWARQYNSKQKEFFLFLNDEKALATAEDLGRICMKFFLGNCDELGTA